MRVTLKGQEVGILDEESLSLKDAFAIKAASGLNLKPFIEGLDDMDPLAVQALVWFLRNKKGEQVHISEIDFALKDLSVEEIADPPSSAAGAVTTSDAAATSTSDSSPTSAT